MGFFTENNTFFTFFAPISHSGVPPQSGEKTAPPVGKTPFLSIGRKSTLPYKETPRKIPLRSFFARRMKLCFLFLKIHRRKFRNLSFDDSEASFLRSKMPCRRFKIRHLAADSTKTYRRIRKTSELPFFLSRRERARRASIFRALSPAARQTRACADAKRKKYDSLPPRGI